MSRALTALYYEGILDRVKATGPGGEPFYYRLKQDREAFTKIFEYLYKAGLGERFVNSDYFRVTRIRIFTEFMGEEGFPDIIPFLKSIISQLDRSGLQISYVFFELLKNPDLLAELLKIGSKSNYLKYKNVVSDQKPEVADTEFMKFLIYSLTMGRTDEKDLDNLRICYNLILDPRDLLTSRIEGVVYSLAAGYYFETTIRAIIDWNKLWRKEYGLDNLDITIENFPRMKPLRERLELLHSLGYISNKDIESLYEKVITCYNDKKEEFKNLNFLVTSEKDKIDHLVRKKDFKGRDKGYKDKLGVIQPKQEGGNDGGS